MNPMTNVKNIQKLNEQVLQQGLEDDHSWHRQYKDSAYIFIGGLPYDLTEGDLLCVFSQYGEIVNINLVRDKKTGKQKGFCFICYEDQRSTILAVDNFNGIKLGGRTIRVDHCSNYRRPLSDEKDEEGKRKEIMEEGCAPKTPSPSPPSSDNEEVVPRKKHKKEKKAKKQKKEKERKEIPDKHRTAVEKYERKDEKRSDKFIKDFSRDTHAKIKHEDDFDRQGHKVKTSSHSNHNSKHYRSSDYDVQRKFNDRNSDGYYRDDRFSLKKKESHSSEYYSRKR